MLESQPLQSKPEQQYPEVLDFSSWDLEDLKKEYEKKNTEREKYINIPKSTINRYGEAKKAANICRQLLAEIEKREASSLQ